jgi:hypothetical protein
MSFYRCRFFLTISLLSQTCFLFGQYQLPKLEVLADHGVKKITVKQAALRYQHSGKKVSNEPKLDTSSKTLITYFINPVGTIDSIFHYLTDTSYYEKDVLTYDNLHRLVRHTTFDANGDEKMAMKITELPDGGFLFKSWSHGRVSTESVVTKDSLVLQSTYHRMHSPQHSYSTYTYDFDRNERVDAFYVDSVLVNRKKYRYIVIDTIPVKFIYSVYTMEKNEKVTQFTETYGVNEKGFVINDKMETIFDPFRLHDYHRRHKQFRGIRLPHEARFSEDTLKKSFEVSQLWRFDGTEIVYHYVYEYEFR